MIFSIALVNLMRNKKSLIYSSNLKYLYWWLTMFVSFATLQRADLLVYKQRSSVHHWTTNSRPNPLNTHGRFRAETDGGVTPRINFAKTIRRTRVGCVSSKMKSEYGESPTELRCRNKGRKTAAELVLCGPLAHRKTFSLLLYTRPGGAKLEN